MRLKINIQEDEQLRKEIKTIIKGQVTAIVRDEIRAIIIEVLDTEGKKLDGAKLEQLAASEVKSHVRAVVNEGSYGDDRKKLDKMVRAEVAKVVAEKGDYIIKEIESNVEGLVDEDIKKAIEVQIKSQVRASLTRILAK